MYKLNTQFKSFKFDDTIQHGSFNITWYKLEEANDDEYGKGLTNEELNQLQNFISNNPNNFPGDKNYHICSEEDSPYCSMMSMIPSQKLNFPLNIIIRKEAKLDKDGSIFTCMDVLLTDQNGKDTHNYNLDFDIIGEINR